MLNTLFVNDVRQTLDQFRRSVDQAFENLYSEEQPRTSRNSSDRAWTFSPMVESGWNESSLSMRAVLPGISENDVRVSVQNNQLLIEGERKVPEGFEKNAYTQLLYGKFQTVITLPTGLDLDRVTCQLRNGVLDIQIPIAEASKPKHIPVRVGESPKTLGS